MDGLRALKIFAFKNDHTSFPPTRPKPSFLPRMKVPRFKLTACAFPAHVSTFPAGRVFASNLILYTSQAFAINRRQTGEGECTSCDDHLYPRQTPTRAETTGHVCPGHCLHEATAESSPGLCSKACLPTTL